MAEGAGTDGTEDGVVRQEGGRGRVVGMEVGGEGTGEW